MTTKQLIYTTETAKILGIIKASRLTKGFKKYAKINAATKGAMTAFIKNRAYKNKHNADKINRRRKNGSILAGYMKTQSIKRGRIVRDIVGDLI